MSESRDVVIDERTLNGLLDCIRLFETVNRDLSERLMRAEQQQLAAQAESLGMVTIAL